MADKLRYFGKKNYLKIPTRPVFQVEDKENGKVCRQNFCITYDHVAFRFSVDLIVAIQNPTTHADNEN